MQTAPHLDTTPTDSYSNYSQGASSTAGPSYTIHSSNTGSSVEVYYSDFDDYDIADDLDSWEPPAKPLRPPESIKQATKPPRHRGTWARAPP